MDKHVERLALQVDRITDGAGRVVATAGTRQGKGVVQIALKQTIIGSGDTFGRALASIWEKTDLEK